jgi:hypothetical protein
MNWTDKENTELFDSLCLMHLMVRVVPYQTEVHWTMKPRQYMRFHESYKLSSCQQKLALTRWIIVICSVLWIYRDGGSGSPGLFDLADWSPTTRSRFNLTNQCIAVRTWKVAMNIIVIVQLVNYKHSSILRRAYHSCTIAKICWNNRSSRIYRIYDITDCHWLSNQSTTGWIVFT